MTERKKREIICEDCDGHFLSESSNAKYCPKCRKRRFIQRHEPRMFTCANPKCGKQKTTVQPTTQYCCNACRVADFRRRIEEELKSESTVIATSQVTIGGNQANISYSVTISDS